MPRPSGDPATSALRRAADAPSLGAAAATRLLALSWVAAANTRFSTLSVAPLLPLVVADLRLSGAGAGLLFGLPVLLMGVCSIPGGALADRLGPGRTVALGLTLMGLGGGARALAATFPP